MKIFVLSMLLILSIESVANAGLDTDAAYDHVIGIYHFESTKQRENGSTYTPDSGIRQINGNLSENVSLATSGKHGKALLLREQDDFCASTFTKRPTFSNNAYSIVAWVKLPKQDKGSLRLWMRDYVVTDGDVLVIKAIGLNVTSDGNLIGFQDDRLNIGGLVPLLSKNQNVANNRWNHIAFTRYANTLSLYINGRNVASHTTTKSLEFSGNYTCLEIAGSAGVNFTGNVFVDDAGFFETGFSSYEIKGLHTDGLKKFLEAMPVNPQGRLTTTWGEIKSRQ